MDQQVEAPRYVSFSSQLRDRTISVRKEREAAARSAYQEARAKAGSHPINQKEGLETVLQFIEKAIWESASDGKDSVTIPFLSVPLIHQRNAYLEANFYIMAKQELLEVGQYVVAKFKEGHPDFDARSYMDSANIVALISAWKITW